jgi:hypothetical protein
MKLEHAIAIRNAAQSVGCGGIEVQEDYCGRGSFGRGTAAVVGQMFVIIPAVAIAARANDVDFTNGMKSLRFDQSGHDVVMY